MTELENCSNVEQMQQLLNLSEELQTENERLRTVLSSKTRQIQQQQSKISTMQSERQELLSAMTRAESEIETLKKRAASVNETELQNKELQRKITEVRAEDAKIRDIARQSLIAAEYNEKEAKKTTEKAETEKEKRLIAEQTAQSATKTAFYTELKYKTLFMGNFAFTILIAILNIITHRAVFLELGDWFVNRWNNILWLINGIVACYKGLVSLIGEWWSLAVAWYYVIASVGYIGIAVGLFFLFRYLLPKLKRFSDTISKKSIVEKTILIDVIVGFLFICIFFAEYITAIIPINIFSIWLIISVISCMICSFTKIKTIND